MLKNIVHINETSLKATEKRVKRHQTELKTEIRKTISESNVLRLVDYKIISEGEVIVKLRDIISQSSIDIQLLNDDVSVRRNPSDNDVKGFDKIEELEEILRISRLLFRRRKGYFNKISLIDKYQSELNAVEEIKVMIKLNGSAEK